VTNQTFDENNASPNSDAQYYVPEYYACRGWGLVTAASDEEARNFETGTSIER
jgi:hypothetical protein